MEGPSTSLQRAAVAATRNVAMGSQALQRGFGSVHKSRWNGAGAGGCPDLHLAGLQLDVDGSGGAQCQVWSDPDVQVVQVRPELGSAVERALGFGRCTPTWGRPLPPNRRVHGVSLVHSGAQAQGQGIFHCESEDSGTIHGVSSGVRIENWFSCTRSCGLSASEFLNPFLLPCLTCRLSPYPSTNHICPCQGPHGARHRCSPGHAHVGDNHTPGRSLRNDASVDALLDKLRDKERQVHRDRACGIGGGRSMHVFRHKCCPPTVRTLVHINHPQRTQIYCLRASLL